CPLDASTLAHPSSYGYLVNTAITDRGLSQSARCGRITRRLAYVPSRFPSAAAAYWDNPRSNSVATPPRQVVRKLDNQSESSGQSALALHEPPGEGTGPTWCSRVPRPGAFGS